MKLLGQVKPTRWQLKFLKRPIMNNLKFLKRPIMMKKSNATVKPLETVERSIPVAHNPREAMKLQKMQEM